MNWNNIISEETVSWNDKEIPFIVKQILLWGINHNYVGWKGSLDDYFIVKTNKNSYLINHPNTCLLDINKIGILKITTSKPIVKEFEKYKVNSLIHFSCLLKDRRCSNHLWIKNNKLYFDNKYNNIYLQNVHQYKIISFIQRNIQKDGYSELDPISYGSSSSL